MRPNLIVLLAVALLYSMLCTRQAIAQAYDPVYEYVQVARIQAAQPGPQLRLQDGLAQYVFDNGAVRLTYSFWGRGGIVSLEIRNLANETLLLDLGRCGLRVNDTLWLPYRTKTGIDERTALHIFRQDVLPPDFDGRPNSLNPGDPADEEYTDDGYKTTLTIARNRRPLSLPSSLDKLRLEPGAAVYASPYMLWPDDGFRLDTTAESETWVSKTYYHPLWDSLEKVHHWPFTPQTSPLHFSVELAISWPSAHDSLPLRHSFSLASITEMTLWQFEGDQAKPGWLGADGSEKHLLTYPYRSPQSFYVFVPVKFRKKSKAVKAKGVTKNTQLVEPDRAQAEPVAVPKPQPEPAKPAPSAPETQPTHVPTPRQAEPTTTPTPETERKALPVLAQTAPADTKQAPTQTPLKAEEAEELKRLRDFLTGVRFAEIAATTKQASNPDNVPNSNPYLVLKNYLKTMGFEASAFTSDLSPLPEQKSQCEKVKVNLAYTLQNGVYNNLRIEFVACNGTKYTVYAKKPLALNPMQDASSQFETLYAEVLPFQKPPYEPAKRIKLPTKPTEWTEKTLTRYYNGAGVDSLEGIYESLGSEPGGSKIRLGIIFDNKEYKVVYLSGDQHTEDWPSGDLKARMRSMPEARRFKLEWYRPDKSMVSTMTATQEKDLLKVVAQNGMVYMVMQRVFPGQLDKVKQRY